MSTVQGIFHVTNNSVEPLEHFAIVVLPPGRGDNRLMLTLASCNSRKTIQAIRDYMAFRPEILCTPGGDFVFGETAEVTEFCFLPWHAPPEVAIWSTLPRLVGQIASYLG